MANVVLNHSVVPTYEAETVDLLTRMTGATSVTRQLTINRTIKLLKDSGIWTKLDALWILAAQDSQAARLNWKSTGSTIIAVNSPTFTVDRGYNGNGTTSYLNTTWSAITNGINYIQDDASMGIYSLTNSTSDTGIDMGAGGGLVEFTQIRLRTTADAMAGTINAVTGGASASATGNTNSLGLFSLTRTSSTNFGIYKNGILCGAASQISMLPGNAAKNICARGSIVGTASLFTTRRYAMAYFGAGSIDQYVFYTIIQSYLSDLGASV